MVTLTINERTVEVEAGVTILEAAAQVGIYSAYFFAILLGFNGKEAAAISIIGGADGPTYILVSADPKAAATVSKEQREQNIKALGGDALPVCIAKTQYSLSDDPTLLGRPTGFNITIRDLRLSNGAGFVVAYAGDVMTMPGLPKVPSAEKIDVDGNGVIHGLF